MPRKQKKYHYIYKTTCNVTNKYYVGMHSTYNLEDGYLGSGKRLRYSINKYGKENHKKIIIEFLPNKESLKEKEAEIVNKNLLNDSLCMNLTLGGNGNWEYLNSNSEVQRKKGIKGNEKMRWLRENDLEWKEKLSRNQSLGHIKSYKNGRIIKTPDWTGKKHKEESKEKIKATHKLNGLQKGEKNSQYGTCLIYNEKIKKTKRIKKEDLNNWIECGWIKGAKFKW